MSSRRDAFNALVQERNSTLEHAGIHASHFTGYFAREESKSGCAIYVSCANENNIDYVKSQLRTFLDKQSFDNTTDPIVA